MALQGTLDTFALPDVLRLLVATKKTGQLRINGERGSGSAWVSTGEVVAIEAADAPHAVAAVDALFELLRFEEGAFTFDADVTHGADGPPTDLEVLLAEAEALLVEWRAIEAVVPSLDAWVTLRATLPGKQVTVEQDSWTTVVAVGSGATVRRLADELGLAELPISRSVKDLVELGLVEVGDAPGGVVPHAAIAPAEAPARTKGSTRPLLASDGQPDASAAKASASPKSGQTASGARRGAPKALAAAPAEPEVFVPLDLPGQGPAASYDEREPAAKPEAEAEEAPAAVDVSADDLAAAFPGLSSSATPTTVDVDDEELAEQLATLSPRAASAIRAAAAATTDEERDAVLDEVDDDDQPLNRGLLLKFLSSVKT